MPLPAFGVREIFNLYFSCADALPAGGELIAYIHTFTFGQELWNWVGQTCTFFGCMHVCMWICVHIFKKVDVKWEGRAGSTMVPRSSSSTSSSNSAAEVGQGPPRSLQGVRVRWRPSSGRSPCRTERTCPARAASAAFLGSAQLRSPAVRGVGLQTTHTYIHICIHTYRERLRCITWENSMLVRKESSMSMIAVPIILTTPLKSLLEQSPTARTLGSPDTCRWWFTMMNPFASLYVSARKGALAPPERERETNENKLPYSLYHILLGIKKNIRVIYPLVQYQYHYMVKNSIIYSYSTYIHK